MLVKDGNGTIVEFEWPSLWYWFKVSVTVCCGVFVSFVLLWIPIALLNAAALAALFGAVFGGRRH